MDDTCATAIKNCDPKGPLVVFIARMVPAADKGRFYGFGRVFSGTLTSGAKVRIMGRNYQFGSKYDYFEKNIHRCLVLIGKGASIVNEVPCGNLIAIVGIDAYLMSMGTLSDHPDGHQLRMPKLPTTQVARFSVTPKNAADLPKLVDGMRKLTRADPYVTCSTDDTG